MDADGIHQRRLTSGPGRDGEIEWFPDGNALLVHHEQGSNHRLLRYDLGADEMTTLVDVPGTIDWAGIRPHDVWFLTHSGARAPSVRNLAGEVAISIGEAPPEGVPLRSLRWPNPHGQTIEGFLAAPQGPGPFPTIVSIHGGPEWHHTDGWDPTTQAYVDHGFAVLLVNYRGSTGFGKKYLNAGDHQMGVGGMQNDLTDAVRWAVHAGVADSSRVAIMGGSYGGYATLAGLAFTPALYACGVDLVGPSDLRALIESFPPYWAPRRRRWLNRIGNVIEDDALNRRISPLHHADQIRAPLLIGHGANDPRVKIAESDTLVRVLRAHGVPVTYVVYPDEGHGFGRPENNQDFWGRVEEFLAARLGGRAEPWREVKGATAVLR